ncbi:MAG: four helix bundle protein [Ignavibacteriales bacterium]|nr:four helix bundle protein [Ignavibacteriales bacterium]
MQDLKSRTKKFALDIIKFVLSLPKNPVCNTLGNQLLRAGTSVGANYRAASRAKSKADFNYKIKVVEEESDESIYWLELIIESGLADSNSSVVLLKEADELTAIFSSISIKNKIDR